MSKAIKSSNRTNAFINKNFIIRVEVKNNNEPKSKTVLTSANKLSNYILDDKLKSSLFNKVLSNGLYKHTFLIRNRLKIVFQSK